MRSHDQVSLDVSWTLDFKFGIQNLFSCSEALGKLVYRFSILTNVAQVSEDHGLWTLRLSND